MKVLGSYKPHLFIDEDKLIVSRFNGIYVLEGEFAKLLFKLPAPLYLVMISKFRLLARILRLEVRHIVYYEDELVCSFLGSVYVYSFKYKKLTKMKFKDEKKVSILNFSVIEGVSGIESGVYFGEYLNNPNKKPISIYYKQGANWKPVYSYLAGSINHIHNIIKVDDSRVAVLSGDFGQAARIEIFENSWKRPIKSFSGKQIYRSCVAFSFGNGLLYFTDTQLDINSINVLDIDQSKVEILDKNTLNGPVIYGTELKDYYVVSTSTEPNPEPHSFFKSIFDRKPAKGVTINSSKVFIISKRDFSSKVLSDHYKDIFPYRLAQFGTVQFPNTHLSSNKLYYYNVANKNGEGKLHFQNLDELC